MVNLTGPVIFTRMVKLCLKHEGALHRTYRINVLGNNSIIKIVEHDGKSEIT